MLRAFDGGPAPAAWSEDVAPITYPDGIPIPFSEVIDDVLHPTWTFIHSSGQYDEGWWNDYRKILGAHPYEIACTCGLCESEWHERMGW